MQAKHRAVAASILISAAAAFGALTPGATTAADFYKDRTVTLHVGSGAGGGYDFFGRVFVKYFGKHIPGNPTVIAVNRPGAGGTKMTNWAANAAPKDGSAIGMPLMPVATVQHLRPKAVRYDAAELNWIGNMERSIAVLFTWHTSKTKTIEDARQRVTLMGGSGKSSPIYQMITLSNRLLGTRFKIVLGYKGGDRALAIERGEVEGSFSTLQNFRAMTPHWFEGGKNPLNVLVQNAVVRSPEIPDVPTMLELAKTDEDREVFEYMMLQSLTGRSIFAPPGVPEDRVNILRRAFDKTMTDPGFVAEIEKSNLKLTPSTGEEVEKAVARIVKTPPAVVARIRELIK